MRITSAGMLGPLLIRGNECSVLQLAGFPPGLFSGVIYDEFTLNLEPGDSVLFCTDGLTDARNVHGREFDWAESRMSAGGMGAIPRRIS